jgi:hypothetical protein
MAPSVYVCPHDSNDITDLDYAKAVVFETHNKNSSISAKCYWCRGHEEETLPSRPSTCVLENLLIQLLSLASATFCFTYMQQVNKKNWNLSTS